MALTTINIFGTNVDLATDIVAKTTLDTMVTATTAQVFIMDVTILKSTKEMNVKELLSANNRLRTIKTFNDRILIEEIYKSYPVSPTLVSAEKWAGVHNENDQQLMNYDYHYFWYGLNPAIMPIRVIASTNCMAVALMSISQADHIEFGFYVNSYEFRSEYLTY